MEKHNELKLIYLFETCQCYCFVSETEHIIFGEKVYVFESIHKRDNSINIRFGNKLQIEGIINTYRNKKEIDVENVVQGCSYTID